MDDSATLFISTLAASMDFGKPSPPSARAHNITLFIFLIAIFFLYDWVIHKASDDVGEP